MIDLLAKGYISQDFFEWLKENGFTTAPASTKYHGACEGGLYKHSKAVMDTLVDFTKKLGLQWQDERSPYIVGMFHDLCKIDQYKIKEEFYDNDFYNDFNAKVPISYVYNDKTLLDGHGDKSIILLSQFMTLTEEEIMCIRYHMGAYETEKWEQFDLVIKKFPNVLYTHTADMYASKIIC